MDTGLEKAFIREIEIQCEYGLVAYAHMLEAITRSMLRGVFCGVQSFLVAAGNVSKIFQPAPLNSRPKLFKQRCQQRGEDLRALFALDVTAPILDRTLRDQFEHYDEAIEDWWSKGHTLIVDQNVAIGMTMNSLISTGNIGDMWRNFTYPPPTVVLGSQLYPLEPLAVSMRAIMVQARKLIRPDETASDAVIWRSIAGDMRVG